MKQENLVIYIYGWGGGEHSKGLIVLREHITNAEIITWTYDQINPNPNYPLIDDLFQVTRKYKNIILIGNSLGGYWANYMAEKYKDIPCILINPSLYPKETLGKYNVDENFLNDYLPSTFHNKNKWLYLSLNDDIINPKIAEAKLYNCNGILWLNEPHAIQDYGFMVEKVRELISRFG